ncbi:Bardet-Biedl syndrome 12 protein [Megalops cyprinoides]|uniref:Bardet-Biedl syndrome 12 protein n=1 Tax=Megalops cyprinoides TaxID=118141 RepID=UPI001864160F|nr:Bardet-Biedl syndrome 12 protein [Megalops cyprinoides]
MSVSGCTVISRGRHIGLQQLEVLAAATNAFLGPNKRYKFVEDQQGGESSLVCSSLRLLEQLDLSCAVGQLLCETVQAHHRAFHTGTGCLLFLAGVWSSAALECLHKGIPVPHIVSAMSEGLEACLETCRSSCSPVRDDLCTSGSGEGEKGRGLNDTARAVSPKLGFGDSLHPGTRKPADISSLSYSFDVNAPGARSSGCKEGQTTLTHRVQDSQKLKHSRHFCLNERTGAESSAPASLRRSGDSGSVNVIGLARALSHGCVEAMQLVIEASRVQTEAPQKGGVCRVFDVNKLVTCVMPGLSEGHACVLRGFVSLISVEQASIAKRFKDQNLNVIIISGDLSEQYRHLGFNRPSNVRFVTGNLDKLGFSKENEWVDEVSAALLRLKVNVLLVNGVVTEKLMERCVRHGLLVVERVKHNVLRDFAETTGAVPVTYAAQLNEQCVGGGVRVVVWGDHSRHGKADLTAVNVQADGTTLATAVITGCVFAKLQALEDRFWGCAHRLHHALKDGKVLPGAGVTEILCIRRLHRLAKEDRGGTRGEDAVSAPGTTNPYRGTVLQHMSDGWVEYIATLMWNSGTCSSKLEARTIINQSLEQLGDMEEATRVYDNVTVKLEAWRRALDLVFLVLLTDTEITTGFNSQDTEDKSDIVLL